MTEEQLKTLTEQVEAEIQANLGKCMAEQITNSLEFTMKAEIHATCSQWIKDEIVPKVAEFLTQHKNGIIKAGCAGAVKCGDILADAMIASMQDKLKNTYEVRKLLEAMFK